MTFRHLVAVASICILSAVVGSAQYETAQPRTRSEFHWPDGKRAAISLSFDDARPSQVDIGIPILDRYGVKATFYASPARLGERLEGWKKAAANGHEIANHSMNHPCSGNFPWSRDHALEDYTLEMMRQELTGANKAIQELVGVVPQTFAYPCGETWVGRGRNLKSYVPVVAELFRAGRGWMNESPNDPAYCDLAQLMGVPSDNLDFDKLKPTIDQAKSQGLWLVLAGHDIGTAIERQTTRTTALEALCRYAKDPANGIWIDTVDAVATYIDKQRGKGKSSTAVYLDPSQPVNRRVEDLLGRMTLEEKIGQMNMPCVYQDELGKDDQAKMTGCRNFAEGTHEPGMGPGGGFFTLANTILHEGPRQQAQFFNELQKIATGKTRLGIPLLQTEEGTHGLMCSGATIFPEGLAIGSTWDPDLVNEIYTIAAREARAVGIHQLFTLVVEPNRDPRLGRNQEGYGEDPYLCSRIAEAIVGALQADDMTAPDKVVAGLCHYPGQSQPVSGLERGAMEISERILRNTFLPPWVAGIGKKGALGVMATYPAIDSIPAHSSEWILTTILRQELGFQGLVLSEGGGISTLVYEGVAADQKQAGEMAIKAGLDVGISYEKGYMQPMIENVREGKVSMALIDRAVRRILHQKYRLGLFENPYVDPDRAVAVSHTPEHREVALRTAREGIVLLKNENNLLPLRKDLKSIAVIGPNADDAKNQLGDYTAHTVLQHIVTVLEGIKAKVSPSTKVTYVKGCNVVGNELDEIAKARDAARNADVAIVVLGENTWDTPDRKGTDGEGYDVATLELTGMQEDLVKAVHASGTPTVVVLVSGRPLAIRWVAANVPSILEAWMCGEMGGTAVADVLFGDYNPEGRLPITFPRHAGQLPVYYDFKPSKEYWLTEAWGKPYADMDPQPLYPFGYGLSYTKFEYSDLRIKEQKIGPDGSVHIGVSVRNTGQRKGAEVVQLYLRDVVSSVTTPVKRLRGFRKVVLEPGEKTDVEFALGPDDLSLLNRHLARVVEPGAFEVMIGASSRDIRLRGKFEVSE
jgi:beta-glucosidase